MRKRNITGPVSVAVSILAHLALLAALLVLRATPLKTDSGPIVPAAFTVALIPKPAPVATPLPDPKPAASAPAAAKVAPVKPPPKRSLVRRMPPRESPVVLAAADKTAPEPSEGVSDAELAGAMTAEAGSGSGGGGGGGGCDMIRRLQTALRKDNLVRAAVAGAHETRAIRVWNGDWVQGHGEDGKGLAAVREAIMWEIAFSPKACQAEAVHGLVSLSLNDASGARLIMGGGAWRWSDLLGLKGGAQTYR